MKIKLVYLFILLAVICSCTQNKYTSPTPTTKTKSYNFSYLYNPSKAAITFSHNIYFDSDSTATVFFVASFNNKNFKSNTNYPNEKNEFIIRFVLRDSTNALCDSATIIYPASNAFTPISNSFSLKVPKKSKYRLNMMLYDNKEQFSQRYVTIITNFQDYSANDFLIYEENKIGRNINSKKYLKTNHEYTISCRKDCSIKVEYFSEKNYEFNPPYQININKETTLIADSTFLYTCNDKITFSKSGNYIFKDTASGEYIFDIVAKNNSYPNITTVREMIDPISLFTTNKIVTEIKNSDNVKNAIDNYWLSLSKSETLAKEQIRVFYRRIELANTFFTEDEDGWKSDRGMIFVIFGPPTILNLSDEGEEWYYGQDPTVAGLLFTFEKNINTNKTSKYRLIRDNAYQPTWAQAISVWKKGRIFSL